MRNNDIKVGKFRLDWEIMPLMKSGLGYFREKWEVIVRPTSLAFFALHPQQQQQCRDLVE